MCKEITGLPYLVHINFLRSIFEPLQQVQLYTYISIYTHKIPRLWKSLILQIYRYDIWINTSIGDGDYYSYPIIIHCCSTNLLYESILSYYIISYYIPLLLDVFGFTTLWLHIHLGKLERPHHSPSLDSWLITRIIPKWPYFKLVNYYNLPRLYCHYHLVI